MNKKHIRILGLIMVLVLSIGILAGCGEEEITLHLSVGDRTGEYSGDMKDGIPDGEGIFTSKNKEGEEWTYEGEFKNGHFEGKGTTTWDDGTRETGTYKKDELQPIKGKALNKVYGNPDGYKDHCVEVTGKVFGEPDYDDGIMAIQIWADPEKNEKNTMVYISDEDFEVEDEDYVRIKGIVEGTFEGENMMGGDIEALSINASEYEVISYAEAVAPTTRTVKVNATIKQYGYSVTVQKVEFSDKDTRVYVKVDNNGTDKFSLFSFDSKLIQDRKQYTEEDKWDNDYPEVCSELAVGVSSEGIIAFPKIEEKDFKLIFEAYSENWEEEIDEYTFDINVR